MLSRRHLLAVALTCFAIAALGVWVLLAEATCVRCPVYPPPPPPTSGPYPAPLPASLDPAGWSFIAEGTTATLEYWVHPYSLGDGTLRILFPPWPSSLNMLVTTAPYTVAGFRFLHAEQGVVTTSGTPSLIPDDCAGPARVRLFLYSLANRGTEYERWYAFDNAVTLVPSSAVWPPFPTITADLADPSAWVSVLGTRANASPAAAAAFSAAQAGAQLGVVFGGACFAGHGVGAVDGAADFVLRSLWVE